ncbi:MAG: zinc ribbon domain-containing protein [Actinobacteria bacterium]|nr:zinc ribbon domain-containing protein [Actinomycetota bacterium]MCG2817493.1 zinc ribbon domain-containing protein [Actinomycetes bacterium]MBU4217977.1 zinc ribbon domain-containing protein [Actinomycetota bacterium]MBU4357909.1 zinc ribbon domain-containing protein [Actinomycetota bacterium]MBU4393040.1 zinc ribbon domain-containing protein [Actinomycetota bacterium]
MKCEFCGENVTEGALACPRCGAPITVSPTRESAPGGPVQPSEMNETADVPLAPVEEDFIAMAEMTVVEKGDSRLASEFATEQPETESGTELADQVVPPGAHVTAEEIHLDSTLTGGYKGPDAPSVGGVGEQTADDPFGLNITETAPPVSGDKRKGEPWDFRRIRNVVVMIVSLLAAFSIAGAGIYFGFIRESKPAVATPEDTVEEFFEMMVTGDRDDLGSVSVSNAKVIGQMEQLIAPYERMGVVSLRKFNAETTSNQDGRATVSVDDLMIEVNSEKGSEIFDMLKTSKPFPVPTVIQLIEQNRKWLISS